MNGRRKVFVTSDWHLGGRVDSEDKDGRFVAGSQICRAITELTDFIRWVASHGKEVATELVINGDMVDFLAPADGFEPVEWLADEKAVIKRLDQIIDTTGGLTGPFGALRELVETSNCWLTILLGNHDVELSLPQVRTHLLNFLRAERGQVRFVYDGEALAIGRLLIEHGNRYDSINVVDYSGLRQERSHLSRGLAIAEADREDRFFKPPAGTLFVVHAFNRLLERYPFLNLLKPETAAALPLMLFLAPDLRPVLQHLLKLRPAVRRMKQGGLRGPADPAKASNLAAGVKTSPTTTFGDASGFPQEVLEIDTLEDLLGSDGAALFPASTQGKLAGTTSETGSIRERLERSVDAFVTKWKDRGDVLLTLVKFDDETNLNNLHRCLMKVQSHDAFKIDRENDDYLVSAKAIIDTGRFDVVVFGHTHLPKQICLGDGKLYLNAGTWAGVMKLPEELYADFPQAEPHLKTFVSNIVHGQIKGYIRNDLGYVAIELQDGLVTTAALCRYSTDNPRVLIGP
jgi:UDP-2,3-diacylglucosamine pyrophosphatase LpxH